MSAQVGLIVGGLALGGIYTLIALGFVLVYKTSQTLNFAHLATVLLGGYFVFQGTHYWMLGFMPAVAVSMLLTAVVGVVLYLGTAAPLVGRPPIAIIISTLGANIALLGLIGAYPPWSSEAGVEVGSPWGADIVRFLGTSFFVSNVWVIGIAFALVGALYLVMARTRWGLLFRAIAEDQEVAAVNGIPVRTVLLIVWAVAGILAASAGAMLGTFPRMLSLGSVEYVVRSIPAVVIGGFDSVHGAIVGGLLVGLIQVYAARYAPAEVVGSNFHLIAPYLVMFGVLLFRQHGLFGQPEVRRV